MSNISLRGIDPDALSRLKARAIDEKTSVNALILQLVGQGMGLSRQRRHNDLDYLAGTWGVADVAAFDQAVAPLAEVDPGLWPMDAEPVCAPS